MPPCKLCLRNGVNLENSHFLPAGVYRILRDDMEKNPNPWLLTAKGAVQTSQQMTARLLCRDCEQRLSRNGENWVLRNCLKRDGSFPMASVLASRAPDADSPASPTKLYFASKIPEINIHALAYFAASVFWRGSIHPWNTDGSVPVKLGELQEQFRLHLMGMDAFPRDCGLTVMVREGKETDRVTSPPYGGGPGTFQIYKFPMPGLAFWIIVGRDFPAHFLSTCFVHCDGNPIVVTSLIERFILEDATRMHKEGR